MSILAELLEKYSFDNQKLVFAEQGKQKQPGVYTITFLNYNKVYVGSTGDLYSRYLAHLWHLNNNRHWNKHLQNVFNKDPEIKFFFLPTETREQAYEVEQELIDNYKPTGLLFNIATDARNSGISYQHTEEAKKKIGDSHRGRKLSCEHKEKIGIASQTRMLGKAMPDWVKQKISQAHQGKVLSDETKKKLSIVRTGVSKGPTPYSEDGWKRMKAQGQKTAKHVVIDGVEFDSQTAAARHFRIAVETVRDRLKSKSPKFEGWKHK